MTSLSALVFRLGLFLAIVCSLFGSPLAAQATFASRTMAATVSSAGRTSEGTLTLSASGVGFESSDYVFNLPVDDIAAVEFSGTRDAFLTLVLDQQSKFPRAYPTLARIRTNSIGQSEQMVVLALPTTEAVDPAVMRARQFQAYIRAHRAEREQAAVGAAGAGDAAHPSLGKTLHVALDNRDGLLTFFPDHLQYDNPDVSIHLALSDILGIEAAGSRGTFLHVGIRPQSQARRAYSGYLRYGFAGGQEWYLPFVLLPSDAVAPSFRLAQDYAAYVDNVRAGREQASVNGGAGAAEAAGGAQVSSGAASSGAAGRREIARFDAAFLERHNPSNKLVNGFKAILGTPGTLIVFDSGLGYVSTNRPTNLKPARLPFLQDGYLKFFVPSEAIQAVRDVSVIRSANGLDSNNTYIAEVDIDRGSAFFAQHRALMADSDQDNRIFLVFKARGALAQFLQEAPHAAPGREQF